MLTLQQILGHRSMEAARRAKALHVLLEARPHDVALARRMKALRRASEVLFDAQNRLPVQYQFRF